MSLSVGTTVLAIDTAAAVSGAALASAGSVIRARYLEEGPARGEALAGAVGAMLEEAGVEVAGLDGLAVVTGPGSYTGLRVGLALVRGLALVDDLPVVGVGSLELLGRCASDSAENLCAVLAANRGRVYAAVFRRRGGELESVAAPAVYEVDELTRTLAALAPRWLICAEDGDVLPEPVTRALEETLDEVGYETPDRGRVERLAAMAGDALAGGEGRSAEAVAALYVGETGARPNRNKVAAGRTPL